MDDLFDEARLLLVFDGWCGVCTRVAEWVRARDPTGRVLSLPNQTPGLIARLGLSRVDVDRAAWAITRDGRRYAGAAAINRTLAEVGGAPWRLLARLYSVPGIGWLQERFYSRFARHRGRFARWGVTPACERPAGGPKIAWRCEGGR